MSVFEGHDIFWVPGLAAPTLATTVSVENYARVTNTARTQQAVIKVGCRQKSIRALHGSKVKQGLPSISTAFWSKVDLKPPQVSKLDESKTRILLWPDHQSLCGQLSSCSEFSISGPMCKKAFEKGRFFECSWRYCVRVGGVAV